MTKRRTYYPNAVSKYILQWAKDDFTEYQNKKKKGMAYYRREMEWEKLYQSIEKEFPGTFLGSLKKLKSHVFYLRSKLTKQQHAVTAPIPQQQTPVQSTSHQLSTHAPPTSNQTSQYSHVLLHTIPTQLPELAPMLFNLNTVPFPHNQVTQHSFNYNNSYNFGYYY